jgi:threonine dehydrogenase-like Zn-dependent dehydrogenase
VVGAGPVDLAAVAARSMGRVSMGRPVQTGVRGHARSVWRTVPPSGRRSAQPRTDAAPIRDRCLGTDGIGLAFEAVKRRGRMAAIGLSGVPDLDIPWDVAVSRAIDLTFSMSSSSSAWEPAIGILAGTGIALEPMVTVFPPGWVFVFFCGPDSARR